MFAPTGTPYVVPSTVPGPARLLSAPEVSNPTVLAGVSRPEPAASGTAGLSRSTTSGALSALTAVVRLLSRSDVGAVVRLIVAPDGAQALTYDAQSDESSYCGYGSQKPIVVTAVEAPPEELPELPEPQAVTVPVTARAAMRAATGRAERTGRTVRPFECRGAVPGAAGRMTARRLSNRFDDPRAGCRRPGSGGAQGRLRVLPRSCRTGATKRTTGWPAAAGSVSRSTSRVTARSPSSKAADSTAV